MSPNSTQFLNNKKATVESFSTNLVLQYITMGQSIVHGWYLEAEISESLLFC